MFNGNTLESGAEQYASMMLERTLVDPLPTTRPEFFQMYPSRRSGVRALCSRPDSELRTRHALARHPCNAKTPDGPALRPPADSAPDGDRGVVKTVPHLYCRDYPLLRMFAVA